MGKMMLMGSCFTTEVGSLLREACLPVVMNPFGILFNPASIASSLRRLETGTPFTEIDVIRRDGRYVSFYHHGHFVRDSAEAFLRDANTGLVQSVRDFEDSDTVVLTFGTAWVYRHKERGIIVSNCHKVPAREFSRERLSVDEVVEQLSPIISRHSDKKWILTVSPIRHLSDGLHGNQLSKATLLLACEALQEKFPACVSYFPSYEILIDELRDYKYYRENKTHPTQEAVILVCERFREFLNR